MFTPEKTKKKTNTKLLLELALLLSAFSFLTSKYQEAKENSKEDDEVNIDELKIVEVIISRLAVVLKPYKKIHMEAVVYVNDVIQSGDTTHANTFLLGITLLNLHSELKSKIIRVSKDKEVLQLFANFDEHIDQETRTKTFNVGYLIFNGLVDNLSLGHIVEKEKLCA